MDFDFIIYVVDLASEKLLTMANMSVCYAEISKMKPNAPDDLTREEFEEFLRAFTHEVRNRLNSIALEAADLAEQAGPGVDASRLQRQIQDCSAFLKAARDLLASDTPQQGKIAPAAQLKALLERKSAESS